MVGGQGALWHCCGTVCCGIDIAHHETVYALWYCGILVLCGTLALSYIVSLSETGVKGAQVHVARAGTQSQCGENFSLGFLSLLITLHWFALHKIGKKLVRFSLGNNIIHRELIIKREREQERKSNAGTVNLDIDSICHWL